MKELEEVWIFNGENAKFPSAIFSDKSKAIEWIGRLALTGILTKYPVDIPVYDWAIANGDFKIKTPRDTQSEFVGKFSSASQEHMHFEDGQFE
ncbi:DUF7710 domain-containing protein [Variovorax boronicumulans]|uniref:DUF7710 domain-containing protein n=1 Tax=Variovorax boronicumulans TaxID=436515 RepID=UPI0033956A5E